MTEFELNGKKYPFVVNLGVWDSWELHLDLDLSTFNFRRVSHMIPYVYYGLIEGSEGVNEGFKMSFAEFKKAIQDIGPVDFIEMSNELLVGELSKQAESNAEKK